MNVSTVDQSPLRKRAARFGWLTFGLATLAIGLLVVAAVRLIQDGPTLQAEAVLVPLNVGAGNPGGAVLFAAALLVVATFVGLAGLQTAAVMRVLAPDRHVPPPPPSAVRRARRLMVGAFDTELVRADQATDWPADRAPHTRGTAVGTTVRCTVLIPAHNEEAILGLTLGVAGRADASPGPRDRRRRQLHRRAPSRSPARTASRWSRPSATPRRRPAR